jgi:hypothetical protein
MTALEETDSSLMCRRFGVRDDLPPAFGNNAFHRW